LKQKKINNHARKPNSIPDRQSRAVKSKINVEGRRSSAVFQILKTKHKMKKVISWCIVIAMSLLLILGIVLAIKQGIAVILGILLVGPLMASFVWALDNIFEKP